MMKRDPYFDNLKGALITLVVIGHFLLPMEQTRFQGTILYGIYLFHMPMFALISGYFAKGVYRDGAFRSDRVARLVWLFFLFKLAVHVTENLAAGQPVTGRIDFFTDSGAPWYLMAMVWWYLTVPLASGLKREAVLACSVAVAVLAGYQDSLGDGLAMSRTLSFAPFFYAGYYLERDADGRFMKSGLRWVFPALALGLSGWIALGINSFWLPYRMIVYGMNYRLLAPEVYAWGGLVRLVCYLFAGIMILGLMAATPSRRMPWTCLGQRTLQIYILHRLLRDMMQYWGFYNVVTSQYRRMVLLVIGLAVAAVPVLGNRWFARAFDRIAGFPDRWRIFRENC